MTTTYENGPFTIRAIVAHYDGRDAVTGYSFPLARDYHYETAELAFEIAARMNVAIEAYGDFGYEVRDRNGKRPLRLRTTEEQQALNWAEIDNDEIPF